ncbi:clumping factor A-like isoform X2 [Bradysia coprophila]|uniref:clumping factor A-like isoform X2 n=1 Tax=Bradysia coprophila TaxID=38358 RepID=UPI00187DAF64|nr:clumping factor A-like isoform X2 [Bradysia coprophila]
MGENNRSSSIVVEDVDSKLKQYMLINKQISRTLSTQRIEISTLKNALRASEAELMQLRMDCCKYQTKYDEITKLYITHVTSLTCILKTNADTFNSISGANNLHETCNALVDQIVGSPKSSVPQNVDNSRRVSKSFDSNKSRSQRRNDDSVADSMDTIEEEDENEIFADVSAELPDSSGASGSDTIIDNSKVESDEESKDSLDGVLSPVQTGNEILEESQLADEQSCKTDGVKVGDDEESDASDDERGGSDEESGVSDEDSGESDEESCENDEENSASDEENSGSDEESDGSDEESDRSDEESDGGNKAHDETNEENETSVQGNGVAREESEFTVFSVVDNGVISGNESSEEESDAENNSENSYSLNQTSILVAHDDSTITNDDDSDKENETANDTISTHSISKNTSSVISVDSDTFDKSTPSKPSKKLPANKKKATTVSDQSISLTYGNMEEQSLVSSTPYRNSNASSDTSDDTTIPAKSSKSRTSSRTLSTTSQSSTSSSVSSGRPRRKAAPVVLSEPKLNTKLRRPR